MLSAAAPVDSAALTTSALTPGIPVNQSAGEAAIGDSIDAFGLDLYAQLQSETGGNLFISPLSIAAALAMTYAGARGQTGQQMANVLHVGSDPAAVESDFGALVSDLNSAGQTGGYVLSVANALWVQQDLNILPEFLTVMQSTFDAGLKKVDFATGAEAARQTINDWVAQQTRGKIQDLFPPGSIDGYTKLVLADAVYLKAAWTVPFPSGATSNAAFTLAAGSQVSASTMHTTDTFRYMQNDGYQVLELPYANGRLAMDILLPVQNGLSGLDSNRLPVDLNTWLGGLESQNVSVSLPKFQMTAGVSAKWVGGQGAWWPSITSLLLDF